VSPYKLTQLLKVHRTCLGWLGKVDVAAIQVCDGILGCYSCVGLGSLKRARHGYRAVPGMVIEPASLALKMQWRVVALLKGWWKRGKTHKLDVEKDLISSSELSVLIFFSSDDCLDQLSVLYMVT